MEMILFVLSPLTLLVDMIFISLLSLGAAWYFYFYQKQNFFGGYVGATMIALLGSLVMFALFQKFIADIIKWLMSPKWGAIQISNVNLIAVGIGALLSLFVVQKIQLRRKRE